MSLYCSATTSALSVPVSSFWIVVVVLDGGGAVVVVVDGDAVVVDAGAVDVTAGPAAWSFVPSEPPQPATSATHRSARGTTIHRSRRLTTATIMML